MRKLEFTLNGRKRAVEVEENTLLLNLIRENLGLTGTKYVCGIGECGSCTVMVDGEPVLSCLTLALDVEGRKVTTIEGLSEGELTQVQESLIQEGGVQCGFCTPGMVMVAQSLLESDPNPSEDDIRRQLAGNLCRCTGYSNIVKGIKAVAEKRSQRQGGRPMGKTS
ncbi:MAG TPA: (2Fe-2S)-binding protein [Conexivisphaerales archaeon]|nr:(2Fe-2S)-binding protein [Conexivisphaerales archaeon]